MENDSIYRRININSITKLVQERNPGMNESDARNVAYKIVAAFSKNVDEIANEFERGDGLFDSCYFAAK